VCVSVGRRRAPAVLGSGSGSDEGRGIRAQGDYRTGERLNQVDLVIENPEWPAKVCVQSGSRGGSYFAANPLNHSKASVPTPKAGPHSLL